MKNKKIITISAVSLALAVTGFAFYQNQSDKSERPQPGQSQTNSSSEEAEQRIADQRKEDLLRRDSENKNQNQSSDKKSVKPIIISSGQYDNNVEVSARVPGIYENSGTCTLRLTKDGKTVSASKKAVPNVSEMSCGFITISRSKLSSGNWSATVSYDTSKASGTSDAVNIKVQ